MKNKNYVGIIEPDNGVSYVTSMDGVTKTAMWEAGQAALPMTKSRAEDLYFGLRCNGYKSVIITMPNYEEPCNPADQEEASHDPD